MESFFMGCPFGSFSCVLTFSRDRGRLKVFIEMLMSMLRLSSERSQQKNCQDPHRKHSRMSDDAEECPGSFLSGVISNTKRL